ncbi:MAG: lamin tail domain-containing protein, partial [Bacteroidetes bacterium]|nr:lamin tail domain-containing protein [Bacteroidota bacterium]
IEKWGGTINNWEAETEYMASFIADRAFHNRQHYAEKFGLGEILEITLDALPQNAGYIEVNTIETDEMPWSGYYFQNLPVRLKAMPYPGFVFDHWEGNNILNPLSSEIIINIEENPNLTAVYLINEDEVNPIINEIKHASGGINNPGDWIELYNPSSSPLDISTWEFCANNDCFELPEGSIIPAQGFIILAQNLSDFQSQYPGIAVLNTQFNFGLSQNGELLTLKDDQGFVRDLVDYETQSPWPAPVLQNHSIELIDPVLDNSLGENWMTQNKLPFGSPGAENVLIPINVSDFEAQQNIKVFPNPFSDFLALQLTDLPKGNYELSVRDLLGQTVRQLAQYIGEDELMILRDLENLSPGLYLLEISNGKSSFQVKVLKK